jgi:hypothetical protein
VKLREVTDRTWRIHLFGDFKLIGPDGACHSLRNRKCEGLIALLAANPRYGVRRDYAASALWPEKVTERQQESLRQAIAIIRRQVGEDFIVPTRTDCRLSHLLDFKCDLDCVEMRQGGVFMPGHEGDWIDAIRLQTTEASEEPTVMSHYLESLRWCARSDPKSLFAFLHANRGMVRGFPASDLLCLLDLAGTPEGIVGWPDYWRGIAEEDLDVSSVLLKKAFRVSVQALDWDLASDSCFELGKTYSRRGKVAPARRIAQAAYEIAERANTKSARINATRLQGTLLLHWGETRAGLELLERSVELVDDPIRRAIVEGTQAWFEAVSGFYGSASRWLSRAEDLYSETGHHQAFLLTSATRALLSVHEGTRTNAIPGLERVARQCYEGGSCQFGVYAEESLAKLYVLDQDSELAAAKLNSARLNRLRTRMAQTPLESAMVAAIH